MSIALDPVHDALWYVTHENAGPILRRFDIASRAIHDVALPADAAGYIGEFNPLKVDPSGAVWLATSDRIVRYDPASGRLATIVLGSYVAGELPGGRANIALWARAAPTSEDR